MAHTISCNFPPLHSIFLVFSKLCVMSDDLRWIVVIWAQRLWPYDLVQLACVSIGAIILNTELCWLLPIQQTPDWIKLFSRKHTGFKGNCFLCNSVLLCKCTPWLDDNVMQSNLQLNMSHRKNSLWSTDISKKKKSFCFVFWPCSWSSFNYGWIRVTKSLA